MEWLIFPYTYEGKNVVVMKQNVIQQKYPKAYDYLCGYKEQLSLRDKGTRQYQEWYAYGRTQALNIKGYKLLFPYLAPKPKFILSVEMDLMFYNGYALVSDDLEQLKLLQKILCSEIFWYYIENSSKPYGGDYMSLAKNYVTNFGVVNLSVYQKKKLMALTSQEDINNYLIKLYKLCL